MQTTENYFAPNASDSDLFHSAQTVFQTPEHASSKDKPFLIQLRQEEKNPSGSFRPSASLQLHETLRTSGLLFALAPEDLKSLLFLLTFLSPNGECQAALHQLASAMRVSALKAQRRMQRLVAFPWSEEPLVLEMKRESGMVFYAPHTHLIGYENLMPPEPASPPLVGGSRAAVLAHSRERYGRPRETVEREMAERMGWDKAEKLIEEKAAQMEQEKSALTPHAREVLQKLEEVGLTTEQALDLLRAHDLLRIERQLSWLPYRHAKNPAGFLLAAIADNYEAPPALRPGSRSTPSAISSEIGRNAVNLDSDASKVEVLGTDRELEIPTSPRSSALSPWNASESQQR